MRETQIQKLAIVHKKIESLLDDNKKGKIILHISENGEITCEVVEEL
jgi:hypothetical protein